MNAAKLKSHLQSFLQGDRAKRSKSQLRRGGGEDSEDANGAASDTDRRSRATTPATGRSLLEEISLRPVGERRPARDPPPRPSTATGSEETCELKNHFRDFMRTPAMVKRGRSFSQPRDKAAGAASGSELEQEAAGTPTTSLSRKESLNDRQQQQLEAERRQQQQRHELANHTKRFLKRKSMINPNKLSDESDNDIAVSRDSKTAVVDKCTELTYSDNDVDNSDSRYTSQHSSPVVLTSKKPPPCKTTTGPEAQPTRQRTRNKEGEEEEGGKGGGRRLKAVQRPDRRTRSKSDITVPRIYTEAELPSEADLSPETDCLVNSDLASVSTQLEAARLDSNVADKNQVVSMPKIICMADEKEKQPAEDQKTEAQITQHWLETSTTELTEVVALPRIRKNNLNTSVGGGEYVYVSAVSKVANARPKPFVSAVVTASTAAEEFSTSNGEYADLDNKTSASYVRQFSNESTPIYAVADLAEPTANGSDHQTYPPISYSNSTTELMNACKSGLRRLTYRKTYSRSRSGTVEPTDNNDNYDRNNNDNSRGSKNRNNSLEGEPQLTSSSITYTQHSSGSRLPNRPTTPGPYMGLDGPASAAALYKRPTTPGPFSRQSWKRTNQKFNYSKFLNYSNHETYV